MTLYNDTSKTSRQSRGSTLSCTGLSALDWLTIGSEVPYSTAVARAQTGSGLGRLTDEVATEHFKCCVQVGN